MRDCPDVELRDLLPDFAAERLSGAERARVAAHVATCADCAAEVELLRTAAQAIRSDTPAVEVGRILAALPKPPAVARRPALVATIPGAPGQLANAPHRQLGRRRPTWTAWRMAAAVSTIAVGGLSVAVLRDMTMRPSHQASAPVMTPAPAAGGVGHGGGVPAGGGAPSPTGGPAAAAPAPIAPAPPAAPGPSPVMTSTAGGLAVAGGVSDLSDGEVEGLLQDLDGLDAVPAAEPEAASPALHAAVSQ